MSSGVGDWDASVGFRGVRDRMLERAGQVFSHLTERREAMEARVGDDYQIACEADAQTLEGMRKLAVVRLTRRGETAEQVFSLVSDEGPHLGGDSSAPTPLMYFVAGVAF